MQQLVPFGLGGCFAVAAPVVGGLAGLWVDGGAAWTGALAGVASLFFGAGWWFAARLVPLGNRRECGLLAVGFAGFGAGLLPLPWSHQLGIAAANRAPISPSGLALAIDLGGVVALAAPWALLLGVMSQVALRRTAAALPVWLGGALGALLSVQLLAPWPGSVRTLCGLALASFAVAVAAAASSRGGGDLSPRPRRRGPMFSLGPLILLCAAALLWIRSDTTAWGHRARRILQAEPACGADARPNVLLVSLDTLRADSIGSYGGPIPTPNLDRVAAEGALFQVAVAPASETAPSHATLFTGRRVLAHGVRKNGISLPMEADTLAERFREAGWTTGAFVSSFVLDPRFGWGQGFAHFDAEFPRRLASFDVDTVWNPDAFWREHRVEGFDRPGVWTARAARDWFARAERPFFAFVHLFDAHEPHAPLRPLRRRVADLELDVSGRWLPGQSPREVEAWNRAYLSDVLAADEALGELLAPISSAALAPCTLLVVTGDHGQGLGQHGWLGHEISLYEEQLRVPLLFHWPGHVLPGRRIEVPVGLEDVAPTIVALAGLPSLTDTHGGSLQPLLRSGVAPPRGPLFARRRHYEQPMLGHRGHQNAIRTTAWKYIRSSHAPDELYYLARDPAELRNVLAQRPRVARRLGAELDAWLAAAPVSQSEETEPLPADVRRGLEALGYVD